MAQTLRNLLDLDRQGMQALFESMGEKRFRADQLMQWIHQRGIADFDAMSNFSKVLRQQLVETCCVTVPEIVSDQTAADGTRKWLLRLDDGNCIETVFIPESKRGTLCISSQVGCTLNCSFCSTARQGFNRNLTTAEIVGQLWLANRELAGEDRDERTITNVVFMGMGEPLLNFDAVERAIHVMLDDFAYGLSKRRVTVSTAGVIPGIERLAPLGIALAVSLHATDDALRDQLVPLNRKYNIAQLLAACRRYTEGRHLRITFEYVMLEGINDQPQHARALLRLLSSIPSKVNLIPFNPFPGSGYQCTPAEAIRRFGDTLWQAGMTTITRKTRGDEIIAACGQLAGRVTDRTRRSQRLVAVGG